MRPFCSLALAGALVGALGAQPRTTVDADELYRHRDDLASASRAAVENAGPQLILTNRAGGPAVPAGAA